MNKIAPFTENQKAYFDRTFTSWFNVAEGGKRGGKNVVETLAFCMQLETHPNRLHLVGGFSIATAKLNVIDCDGFGMTNYFTGRCREGEYKNRRCLYVQTATGEKVVLISGGGKDGDQKLIQGNTYGMVLITEANLCYPSFIKEAFDRTLSSKNRKIFHDLNPKDPRHPYYKDVLDFHTAKQAADPSYGYNYGHMTISDNMSMSDEEVRTVINTYDKKSVWFRRDILGKRTPVEGVIYRQFADDPERYVINTPPHDIQFMIIGVDFGGTKSAQAFQATGFKYGMRGVVTIDEYYTKDPLTPTQLEDDFVAFVKKQLAAGYNVIEARADSEMSMVIRGFRNALVRAHIGVPVQTATKGSIIDRISFYNMMFANDRYKIVRTCKHTIEAFYTAVWDSKKFDDVRLDNGEYNIDSLDAQEYSTETHQRDIIDLIKSGPISQSRAVILGR